MRRLLTLRRSFREFLLELLLMKLSKYCKLFISQGSYFIYSSLTNSFAQIESDVFNALDSGKFEDLPEEVLQTLKSMKVLGVDDELEKEKIKYKILSSRFNPQKLYLTINPTLACNFACAYCFEGQLPNHIMTAEVEDAIVRFVNRHELAKEIHVNWFGGEPLMAFDNIISLTKKLQRLGKNYFAGMITNGYLMTPDKVAEFRNLHIKSVQITIDGSAEVHNKRRPLRNGKKTFETIVHNIQQAQLVDADLNIIIRVNLDRDNQSSFDEVLTLFPSKDYPSVRVYPAFVSNANGIKSNCSFDDNGIASFLLKQYYEKGRYSKHFYPEFNRGACAVRKPNSFVIGPKGELYKCWNDVGIESKSFGTVYGAITNERILYNYLIKADPLFNKECDECAFMPVLMAAVHIRGL